MIKRLTPWVFSSFCCVSAVSAVADGFHHGTVKDSTGAACHKPR